MRSVKTNKYSIFREFGDIDQFLFYFDSEEDLINFYNTHLIEEGSPFLYYFTVGGAKKYI